MGDGSFRTSVASLAASGAAGTKGTPPQHDQFPGDRIGDGLRPGVPSRLPGLIYWNTAPVRDRLLGSSVRRRA